MTVTMIVVMVMIVPTEVVMVEVVVMRPEVVVARAAFGPPIAVAPNHAALPGLCDRRLLRIDRRSANGSSGRVAATAAICKYYGVLVIVTVVVVDFVTVMVVLPETVVMVVVVAPEVAPVARALPVAESISATAGGVTAAKRPAFSRNRRRPASFTAQFSFIFRHVSALTTPL